ncbi:sulfatase-like hydrolase/transferase [Candidatus Venteria ishoeyi]|uniref:Phosphoethanolamine transferase EptB n=1 Tax=Candidatus Venteria ishoeyi TaxID=1899563 RepID=A0A1H6F6B2_9GAMM|nr:sulfatase-like hydrolase/transferase [Candidatus Venteria ishoeyi]SEH05707.1 Phosphoethanolamine transferase EptB [Candidatus Venteria ishoeyi]
MPDDLGVLLQNIHYWVKNSPSLFSLNDTIYILLYSITFYIIFSFSKTKKSYKIKQKILLILFSVIICIISFSYIKKENKEFLLLPLLSVINNGFLYVKDNDLYANYKYKERDYIQRDIDDIKVHEERGRINVLMIIQESLRGDHLSIFGYHRKTTPIQDIFFKNAYLFINAISNRTTTGPSLSTLFTGTIRVIKKEIFKRSLIWQYAKRSGKHTFYITSHWIEWNFMKTAFTNLKYIDFINSPLAARASIGRDDILTVDIFNQYLTKIKNNNKPFFGVLHFSGTHYPYSTPSQHRIWKPSKSSMNPNHIDKVINQYDNSIRYNDFVMGKALKHLEKLGLSENTIIILTSDHGEGFYEHKKFFHGKGNFWQEGIHIPFIIHIPESLKLLFSEEELFNLNKNIYKYISNVDIFPTLMDIWKLSSNKKLSGNSLLKVRNKRFSILTDKNGFLLIETHTGIKRIYEYDKKQIKIINLITDPDEKNINIIQLSASPSLKKVLNLIESKSFNDKQLEQEVFITH